MSTRVWTAYRLKRGYDLWSVLRDVRVRAQTEATAELRKLYARLIGMANADADFRKHAAKTMAELAPAGMEESVRRKRLRDAAAGKEWGMRDASLYVRAMYGRARMHAEKDYFDLDVSVAARRCGSRYYLVPYPGSGLLSSCLNHMARHQALEDFHYQDVADKPKRVKVAEWEERRRVWEYLLADSRQQDYLVAEVVSFDKYHRVDPVDIDFMRRLERADKKRSKS